MNKLKEILFLKSLKGVGKNAIYAKYWKALNYCNDVDELKKIVMDGNNKYTLKEIDEAVKKAETLFSEITGDINIGVITVFDESYPNKLNVMGNKRPLILYVKGNMDALKLDNIAIIGTRSPSQWSIAVEEQLVKMTLKQSDRVVVSGLALGCDRIAHEITVKENRITIAVMPCGVNIIAPASNKQLAEEIIKTGGCLVSEYEPNTKPIKTFFVERDSIVAAISDITLVVECGIKSGTMHTVDAAVEYNRPVGCYYPKDFSKGSYEGNDDMITNKGAVKVSDTNTLVNLLEIKNNVQEDAKSEVPMQLTIADCFGNSDDK